MVHTAEPRSLSRPARPRWRSTDIALFPEPDLLGMAMALQNSRDRGVLCTAGLSPEQVAELRAGLSRPLTARRPLHPMLERTAQPRVLSVADYHGKDTAVTKLGQWAASCGLNPRTVSALEQGVDELLLNALFDAPQDGNGRPRYVALSPQQRVETKALPGEQAEVRYASDTRRVVVAVRDRCGSLRRGTVLSYLIRCATAQNARRSPLENKAGGAGVGLYLVACAANELLFRLQRGRLTEVAYVVYRDRARPLRALIIDDDTVPSTSSGAAPTRPAALRRHP